MAWSTIASHLALMLLLVDESSSLVATRSVQFHEYEKMHCVLTKTRNPVFIHHRADENWLVQLVLQCIFHWCVTSLFLFLYRRSLNDEAGALVSGSLFARIKRTKWQMVFVSIIQMVFTASMASADQHHPGRAICFVALAAFGVGASQIIALLIIQFGASDDSIGLATGYHSFHTLTADSC